MFQYCDVCDVCDYNTLTKSGDNGLRLAGWPDADGSEATRPLDAPDNELLPTTTLMRRQLANTTVWDPSPLEPGETATVLVSVPGAAVGDVTFCGHSGLQPGRDHVQLSSISGEGVVQAMLYNVGKEVVDVGSGRLRVVVMQ
eukprot:COSAG05_NODE_8289_length_718_cov_0.762520_2_plen_142_part_00